MKKSQPEPPSDPTLRDYQKKVEKLMAEVRHPRLGAFTALAEELGEIGKEILALEIYGSTKNPGNLGRELADGLVALLELASAYDMDIQHLLDEKLKDLETRVPEWSKKFGPNLAKKRKKMD